MDGVPVLTAQDLKQDLEEAYRIRRHHHLFAFFGTGVSEEIEVGEVPYRVKVVPVRSELELRDQMPALGEDDEARVAFLVPWTHDIPLDLAGRFALNGRVRKIGKESRLKTLFGVSEVDEDARKSPLATYLLGAEAGRRYATSGSRLTLEAMWSAWLRADWGLDTEGGLGLDVLLAFAAQDGRGPAFFAAMQQSAEATTTRSALLSWLEKALGPCARVVWRAWEEGRGRRALELALVFEPLMKSPLGAVRMWVKTKAREALSIDRDADAVPVAEALGREAAGAWRVLERKWSTSELRAVARAADALVVDEEVQAGLAESRRLPSAWARRLDGLGEALSRGVERLTAESVLDAAQALRALDGHAFFKDQESETVLTRAEMAVRLLAWLVARPDRRLDPGHTPYGEAEVLGRWYATEGGYVDRARHLARGAEVDVFGRAVQAVVAKADEVRTELDLRFARGLAAWVESGQPSTQVLPIHDAVKRIAARFLDGDERRRLLVLLLDGMAWTQASELLESLGQRAVPWGPLTWHVQRDTRIGEGPLPVVFAALPTVTEVSRSAFFAGKALGGAAKLTTSDTEHWAANSSVKRFVGPSDVPRLLLRSEGHTKAGGASPEALSLVADTSRRVVAMVLNAIDDSLKASHAVRHAWGVDNIASLPDLLERARESGRAVLLASDHGHVPADRLQRVPAASTAQGARWRVWPSASAPVGEHEVGFSGSKVYTPPGAHGVVLLADDASCYVGSTHAGEHGGATLAEVVAPCVLIGCEDAVEPVVDDAAQRPMPAHVPRWWHFDVGEEPVEVEPRRKEEKKAAAQLGLPVITPSVAVEVEVEVKAARVARSAFGSSAVLNARAKKAELGQVIEAVEVLLERGGVMSAEAFAVAMKVLPFRVGGLTSKLQEVLNLDGYEVLRYDAAARQVHLDKGKLAQLFEVVL